MAYLADEAAAAWGPGKGRVLGDESTTGTSTVEYLDCTAFRDSWYRLTAIGQPLFYLWVEDATPATTPTTTATSGMACMDYLEAGTSIERRVPSRNGILAYATVTAGGKLRIAFDGGGDPRQSP